MSFLLICNHQINHLEIKELLKLCFEIYVCFTSSLLFSANKTLTATDVVFDLKLFQSFKCDGKLISLQLYQFEKGLICDICCGSFTTFSWFNAIVTVY